MTSSSPTASGTGATKTFADFGIDPRIVAALGDAGITAPFPIQELTLPLALSGADIIGQARTGTGKTIAFGVPLLQRVDLDDRAVQGLVVVPTRELCVQVTQDLTQAGARKGVRVVAVYGGKAIDPQAEALKRGAHTVVGTPGRLLDLLRRGVLDLSKVTGLVLDEADEMLDLGFLPDVEQLIEACALPRQTLLFSATMPSPVVALARRYMHKPTFLRADVEEVRVAPETEQYFFSCHRLDKPAVLARILQTPSRGLCLVFTRTKRMADTLTEELRERGVPAAPIHSDLRQEARERALSRFRRGKVDVLVATEVAARGLDITDVTHVVNYDCPDDERMYLHRIGRTGRAGAPGVAITLAVWNELARLEMIKKALDIQAETHEVFSTSPIVDELFDLPPRGKRQGTTEPDDTDQAGGASADDVGSTEVDEAGGAAGAQGAGTPPEDGRADATAGGGRKRGRSRRRRGAGGGAAAGTETTRDTRTPPATEDTAGTKPAAGKRDGAGTKPAAGKQDGAGAGAGTASTGEAAVDGERQGGGRREADAPEPRPRRQRVRARNERGSLPVPDDAGRPQPEVTPGEAPHAAPAAAEREAAKTPPAGREQGDADARSEESHGRQRGKDGDEPRRTRAQRRGRGRRGRPDRRRRERQPAAAGGEAVRPEDVRGSGKPRLTRPFVITHLP